MKICVAQTRPVKGDIQYNIQQHIKFIELAVQHEADIIIFPELSATGYQPELAKQFATTEDDNRFDDFQKLANQNKIAIGVGMPVNREDDICIGMILFQPQQPRQVYHKKYLHQDEESFFVCGENLSHLCDHSEIALAICYELSVPEHSADAAKRGAKIYIASVAKTSSGVDKAIVSLTAIAQQYSMTVLMANCIGMCDGVLCAGTSSAWNTKGELIDQLDATHEGILVLDSITLAAVKKYF